MYKRILIPVFIIVMMSCCTGRSDKSINREYRDYAQCLLDSVIHYYSLPESGLYREYYAFSDNHQISYLASQDTVHKAAFLWPTSGMFSALNMLAKATGDKVYEQLISERLLPILHQYYDTIREPNCYQSYLVSEGMSDRYYDDNIWIGIDYVESYELFHKDHYLKMSESIWRFIESGRDLVLEDGIYWCEQHKSSKNTCSNAPAAVWAMKLYLATGNEDYIKAAENLYQWTVAHLQDSTDYLFFDNIKLDGTIDKNKYPYNSGQMLQAASLLYTHTHNKRYLDDAQKIALSCRKRFFTDKCLNDDHAIRFLKHDNIWFLAVMLRGFEEYYRVTGDSSYLSDFKNSLDYLWNHNPNSNKLFDDDCLLLAESKSHTQWLLTQAAMIEMYARLSIYPFL